MRWTRSRSRAVLATVSAGFCLFIGEVFLHWFGVRVERNERAIAICQRLGKHYDRRTQLEVVQDLRSNGKDAWPVLFARHFYAGGKTIAVAGKDVIPLGSISNVATVTDNESGEYLVFDSDEFGFQNPSGNHRRDGVDVALLGDSFVLGAYVPVDQNIAGWLRKRGLRTLNCGMVGNGPLCNLATLREYVQPLRPKQVVWFFSEENDADDILLESRPPLKRYLDDGFKLGLADMASDIDQELRMVAEIEYRRPSKPATASPWTDFFRLRNTRAALNRVFGKLHPSDYETDWKLLGETIRTAARRVRADQGSFLIAYLPCHSRYVGIGTRKCAKCHEFLTSLAAELKVPFVDMVEEFAKAGDPLDNFPFRLNGHYNADGYRRVAGALAEKLNKSAEKSAP